MNQEYLQVMERMTKLLYDVINAFIKYRGEIDNDTDQSKTNQDQTN